MEEIISKLAAYITGDILKQPKRIIRPDELIISSGLIDSFSLVDIDSLEQLANLIQSRQ
jgi:hypothetical protein